MPAVTAYSELPSDPRLDHTAKTNPTSNSANSDAARTRRAWDTPLRIGAARCSRSSARSTKVGAKADRSVTPAWYEGTTTARYRPIG